MLNRSGFQTFVDRQHQAWAKDYRVVSAARAEVDLARGVPIEQFRTAIRKIQADKGWSLLEIAARGGQQPGWLNSYMYGDRAKTIGRETARMFFARIAGLPVEPSPWLKRLVYDGRARVVELGRHAELKPQWP